MKLFQSLFITLAISSGSLATEPSFVEGSRQLTVRVYDYADAKPGLLQRAREQAAEILLGPSRFDLLDHAVRYRCVECEKCSKKWPRSFVPVLGMLWLTLPV